MKFYFIVGSFPFLFTEVMGNAAGNLTAVNFNPGIEEYTSCQEDSLMLEEKSSRGKNTPIDARPLKGKVSLLSFNFIYYAIYKFMYIEDIFDLTKRSKNISQ